MNTAIRPVALLLASLFAASCSHSTRAEGRRVPVGEVIVQGEADSLFLASIDALEAEGFSVVAVDSSSREVVASTSDSGGKIFLTVTPAGDSSAISVQGSEGGFRAMLLGMGALMAITRTGEFDGRRLPDGAEWAEDEWGRVGFALLSERLAADVGVQPSDTAFEVRPAELPPDFRSQRERDIARSGFDPGCARVFEMAGYQVVRFNRCENPQRRLDRLEVFRPDGSWFSSTIGPTVGERIVLMCPASRDRSIRSGDDRCPEAFR